MNRPLAVALALLLAGGLQACCIRTGNAAADDVAAAPSPDAPLEILSWGPRQTARGVPFNTHGGRSAAIWIQVNRSLDGRSVLVQFDDAYLEGNVSGDVVTAAVPELSYADPGVYEVRVIASAGRAHWNSNRVAFTVR